MQEDNRQTLLGGGDGSYTSTLSTVALPRIRPSTPPLPSKSQMPTPFEQIKSLKYLFHSCSVPSCPTTQKVEAHLLFYSNALYCVVHHGDSSLTTETFPLICLFECSVLEELSGRDKEGPEMDYTYTDVYCEQDVESLSFRVFQNLLQRCNVLESSECLYSMLMVLYMRKEYERFFTIYDMKRCHTIPTYQLALLSSLCLRERAPKTILAQLQACLKLTEVADKLPEEESRWVEALKNPSAIRIEHLSPQEREALYYALRRWFNQEYRAYHWTTSLKQWSGSKDTEGAAEAMIDLCVKFREYEKGWSIYKEVFAGALPSLRILRLSSQVMTLAIRALNTHSTATWTERLLEVSTVISRLDIDKVLKIKNTFSMLVEINSYSHMSYLSGRVIMQYPPSLISTTTLLVILRSTLSALERHPKEVEEETAERCTPPLIAEALSLYTIWKKNSERGILSTLFFGTSDDSFEVYSLVLSITLLLRRKETTLAVCRDIWESGLDVTPALAPPLVQTHASTCLCTKYINSHEKRAYLSHIITELAKR
ncbi:hypothetical protein NEDG_01184 [Nematocida displodere]|uniref:Uncharacterized protein n=1 Tax=Nematocida displodere TaxID=1805483 RepID=A0A177EAT9_9MICR|nr:hypothetical protein NEDG_01184 [Nematocida displodere]